MIKSGNFRFTVIQIEGKSTLQHGQKAEVTLEIMDTQSVRWGNNCSFGGFDGAKKVKGMKRHVVEQISGGSEHAVSIFNEYHKYNDIVLFIKNII